MMRWLEDDNGICSVALAFVRNHLRRHGVEVPDKAWPTAKQLRARLLRPWLRGA